MCVSGELLTNRTWNYKTPGPKDIPIDFRVRFIETENTSDRVGVLRSKATGEPAVALAYVVVCALRHALHSVLKDNGQCDTFLPLGITHLFETFMNYSLNECIFYI